MRILLLLSLLLVGCTEKERARNFGGTYTSTLPPNKKLINVTWKETTLWALTRDMRKDEFPETYEFDGDADGIFGGGHVTIKESVK